MKKWIRDWLGITDVYNKLRYMHETITTEHNLIIDVLNTMTVKLTDEFEPTRKALSDRLGKQVIDRLHAEDKARRMTLGEPYHE